MSDREAFEKWWPSVGQTIGKVAAWQAWQAAQAQTLLEVIRDDIECPVEVRVAESLQHSESEPVAWHISKDPDDDQSSHVTADGEFASSYAQMGWKVSPLYTTPQPVVPEAKVWNQAEGRDGKLYADGWNACRDVLLSAGKGGEE